MRILYPIGSFYPAQSGGPNNSIYWLAKSLEKKDVKCIVVTTDEGLKLNKEIVLNKWLETEYGKIIYTSSRIHQLPLRMIYHTVKQMKNADLIHLTSVSYLPSLIIATMGRLMNRKLIWSPRGELEKYARGRHAIVKHILFIVIKWVFKNKVTFHSTCKAETENIKHYLKGTKMFALPNYLLLPKSIKAITKRQFLYIGRLDPIKALENIIEGFFFSKAFLGSEFEFIIAGTGDENYIAVLKGKIKKFALDSRIKFVGHINGVEKDYLYASSYFTLLLSHSENFGNVVVESLSQGTPVIASTGTPWEALLTYKAGFWIDNSPILIAEMIDRVIALDSEDYNTYRLNSKLFVESHFDIEKNVGNWIKEYQNVCSND